MALGNTRIKRSQQKWHENKKCDKASRRINLRPKWEANRIEWAGQGSRGGECERERSFKPTKLLRISAGTRHSLAWQPSANQSFRLANKCKQIAKRVQSAAAYAAAGNAAYEQCNLIWCLCASCRQRPKDKQDDGPGTETREDHDKGHIIAYFVLHTQNYRSCKH